MYPFNDIVSTSEELRAMMGESSQRAQRKVIHYLDEHCRNYIAKTPLVILSTADENGLCDASPRGDQSGFVKILDDKHLVIPDRPGNKRVDTMLNILSNPNVGLLFVIPGLQETLRINGKACLIRDQDILAQMAVNGKTPQIAIGVEVEQVFLHCGKAMIRSSLWNPETWLPKDELPCMPQMMVDHAKIEGLDAKQVKESWQDGYKNRLY
ncbi:pyridoxamine 5'-phosphate oxidase family protein [Brevibacillus ginsengisoli]|uniref:pyridoxamine 5'-phosphate oxidase family protein n=1 Tax=Brevibacillus ginsengisoli TaxID=363854 RepID=UPI003CED74CD